MRQKKKDRGFTLVEILICLAITAIVGIFLAGFLGPQINTYHALDEEANAKSACDTVFNCVQNTIRTGKNFSVEGDELHFTQVTEVGSAETETVLRSDSFDGEVSARYRGNITVTYDITDAPGGNIAVTVAAAQNGKTVFSMTQAVRCRNAG